MLLGLDTGGSYTDAVLLDGQRRLLSSAKALTTPGRLQEGLANALKGALKEHPEELAAQIELVALSTTLATNALVESHGRPSALVLIGYGPELLSRAGLREALGSQPVLFLEGGHNADGSAKAELDFNALNGWLDSLAPAVQAIAVSGVFAVRNPEHELAVREHIAARGEHSLTCGHELSAALDAPRRALTALLNARLIGIGGELLDDCEAMMLEAGIDAPLMVVRGDGSLVNADTARRHPVETILSGPAASVVGAAWLSGGAVNERVLVADIGGTTTDLAVLEPGGQPRLAEQGARVGGWRTMVKAVDVQTIGLGGDSLVQYDRESRQLAVGPGRAIPLARLCSIWPDAIQILLDQLESVYARTHDGQFVVPLPFPHPPERDDPPGLSPAQRDLWARIRRGPIALSELFSDQTLERPLQRLVARGLARRAAFTPTDASHLLGEQADWELRGSELGARLLQRYALANLGPDWPDTATVARATKAALADRASLAFVETLLMSRPDLLAPGQGSLSPGQQRLIRAAFSSGHATTGAVREIGLSLSAQLHTPVIALGASAAAHLPAAAQRLRAQLRIPEHAGVANAVGAIVGLVRERVEIELTAVGNGIGQSPVRVHGPDGPPQILPNPEAALEAAEALASSLARTRAELAGAAETAVELSREENVVEQDGVRVFFGARVVAVASGRPGTS